MLIYKRTTDHTRRRGRGEVSAMTDDDMKTPIEIPLTRGLVALVDADDYEGLNKFKWSASKNRNTFYAGRFHGVSMHSQIVAIPKGMQCDHIDGDGLNNQKSNLRVVSVRVNQQNRHVKKASKHPGLFWQKALGKWVARIRVGHRRITIGCFKNETDAANAYMAYSNVIEYSKNHIVGGCCND
jgi:hypothetical protein